MNTALMPFSKVARRQQSSFRGSLDVRAGSPEDSVGVRHGYLLAHGYESENLYPGLRVANRALTFFGERSIKWWTSARSGDRSLATDFVGPTRNLASSQVSCVNFLLPLAEIPGALTALLKGIDPDVTDVKAIVDRSGHRSPVEFEWVGWDRPLEGGRITRGAYQTSVDALLVARTRAGRRAYLIEWKYCEAYPHPENKGLAGGDTRRARYGALFGSPESPFKPGATLDDFLFEPFYQIMRLRLLAERMRQEGVTPDLKVDDARLIVICPEANQQYRIAVQDTPLAARFPAETTVEGIVRNTLKDPVSFAVVGQETLVETLRQSEVSPSLGPWLEYHRARYGW
jgi:hypothetical protein